MKERSWLRGAWLGFCCVTLSLVVSNSPALCAEQTSQNASQLQAILTAWQNRQEQVQTFDFFWEGTRFVAEGMEVVLSPLVERSVPLEDVSFPVSMRCVLDRSRRIRLEIEDQEWSDEDDKYVPKTTVMVYDGQIGTTLYTRGTPAGSAEKYPSAHIGGRGLSRMAKLIHLMPLWLIYRPLDPDIGVCNSRQVLVTGKTEKIDDRECLVLRVPGGTLCVDAGRDFLPMRYTKPLSGGTARVIDIQYARDSEFGWVPRSWKLVKEDRQGQPLRSDRVTVTDFSINRPLPDSLFQVEIPVGAYVNNYIKDEQYLMREGGEKRVILPGEMDSKSYSDLLESDPPIGPGGAGTGWAILIAMAVVLLAAVIALIYRRKAT